MLCDIAGKSNECNFHQASHQSSPTGPLAGFATFLALGHFLAQRQRRDPSFHGLPLRNNVSEGGVNYFLGSSLAKKWPSLPLSSGFLQSR